MKGLPLAFKFARRELRAGLKGFYVFILCLVLGVGAIAGVQSLSRGLIDSLQGDGRYILGGDIAIRTLYAPPAAEQMDFLKNLAAFPARPSCARWCGAQTKAVSRCRNSRRSMPPTRFTARLRQTPPPEAACRVSLRKRTADGEPLRRKSYCRALAYASAMR